MDITPIDDEGRLFVSGAIDEWSELTSLAISVVIDLEGGVDEGIPVLPGGIQYLCIPFEDDALPDRAVLAAATEYVERMIASGRRVLVHCSAGINRSPLFAGVVLHRLGWSGRDALERLRERRPGALYNELYSAYLENLDAIRRS